MREISSASVSNFRTCADEPILVANARLSQYLVSRASFNAILYLCMKSALLWAGWVSCILAPIDVPERNICFDNILADGRLVVMVSANFTISTAKAKDRLPISPGPANLICSLSFTFYFCLFTFSFIPLLSRRRGLRPGLLSIPFCRPACFRAFRRLRILRPGRPSVRRHLRLTSRSSSARRR